MIAAVRGPDGGLQRLLVAQLDLVEACHLGAEAFQIFLIPRGGDARQGAAVKGARKADDMEALGMAAHILVAARHLEGEFAGLGPRIGEEHGVGEGALNQLARQALLSGHAVEVGGVPDFARLLGQGRDQLGMAIAKGVDRDARTQV